MLLELREVLKNENEDDIIQIIQAAEKNLEKIGVVSPTVKSLIRLIEKKGGAAKICGGGGRAKGTGIILVYHKNKKVLESLLRLSSLQMENITLIDEGVRREL